MTRRPGLTDELHSAELLDLYRSYQDALQRWGDTHVALDLLIQLLPKLDCPPYGERLEAELERVHLEAFPDGATRPTRLTTLIPNPFEQGDG